MCLKLNINPFWLRLNSYLVLIYILFISLPSLDEDEMMSIQYGTYLASLVQGLGVLLFKS